MENKKNPKATNANLKASAANGSLLSIIGLVVIKADDQSRMNMKGNIFTIFIYRLIIFIISIIILNMN